MGMKANDLPLDMHSAFELQRAAFARQPHSQWPERRDRLQRLRRLVADNEEEIERTLATPAIADGLLYMPDCTGNLHCFDAGTGEPVWKHDAKAEIWASTLVADGKVYVGTHRGELLVLAAGREEKLLGSADLGSPIHGTACAAGGVLYVATMTRLYALARTPAGTQARAHD